MRGWAASTASSGPGSPGFATRAQAFAFAVSGASAWRAFATALRRSFASHCPASGGSISAAMWKQNRSLSPRIWMRSLARISGFAVVPATRTAAPQPVWMLMPSAWCVTGLRRAPDLDLAARDEVGERLLDRGIHRRALVFRQHPLPGHVRAMRGIEAPRFLPALEVLPAREHRDVEGFLVARERVCRAEVMPAWVDLRNRVERELVGVHFDRVEE